jgi:prepilin-type processing-associated H-X9-DG protein
MTRQVNGVFNDLMPMPFAAITDGLGNTIFVTERALAPLRNIVDLQGPAFTRHGWMISGNWGDTLVTSFYAPNLYRKVPPSSNDLQFFAASSLHPGGMNALMGDGSVRFLKETISTWTYDPASGAPLGTRTDAEDVWTNLPAAGVFQALSTRSGGEPIPAD